MNEIYEIPSSVDEIFEDLIASNGNHQYRIIDYTNGLDMDNIQSMEYFIDQVGIEEDFIVSDEGTLIILNHPDYGRNVAIHSSGLGDFYSHGFDVEWEKE